MDVIQRAAELQLAPESMPELRDLPAGWNEMCLCDIVIQSSNWGTEGLNNSFSVCIIIA